MKLIKNEQQILIKTFDVSFKFICHNYHVAKPPEMYKLSMSRLSIVQFTHNIHT